MALLEAKKKGGGVGGVIQRKMYNFIIILQQSQLKGQNTSLIYQLNYLKKQEGPAKHIFGSLLHTNTCGTGKLVFAIPFLSPLNVNCHVLFRKTRVKV